MQMHAWIYRTKLRNRWVKISTVHFQKSIRVIFEPVTFEISIDCMNHGEKIAKILQKANELLTDLRIFLARRGTNLLVSSQGRNISGV